MAMLELKALDIVDVARRGLVYIVQLPAGQNPRDLVGHEVVIDGQRLTVRGVETTAVPDGHSALDAPCGLLAGP